MVNISEVVNELKENLKYKIEGPETSEKIHQLRKDIFKYGKYDTHMYDEAGRQLKEPDLDGMLDKLENDLSELISDLCEIEAWRKGYAEGIVDCLAVSNLQTLKDLASLTVKD